VTYCVGIWTHDGLVLASDSRTNAGYDQVNTCRKLHVFEQPGDRVFILLSSGSLSLSQSVLTSLRRDAAAGEGLAAVTSLYDAARVLGEQVRAVARLDRAALEQDGYQFNTSFILGGQVRGEPHGLYLVYPQGNPLSATEDTPYLQIGEVKYGRPILDRGIRYGHTTVEEATRYALISLDSTMRSNVTVGPPVDLVAYEAGELRVTRRRRFRDRDPDYQRIRTQWEVTATNGRGGILPHPAGIPAGRYPGAALPDP
jgi:putative proteasome-type protease